MNILNLLKRLIMSDALKSKVAKVIYIIFAAGIVFMCGSWATNKSLDDHLESYKNYTIDQVVTNVLNKKGGIADQITDVKTIVLSIQSEQRDKNAADYTDWVTDIEKYYGWCDGYNDQKLDSKFVEKMSNYWKALPESYKTDVVKLHYQYAMDYISKHCK